MSVFVFILGLCLGSFVFALYERFVRKKALFTARSYCFECEKKLHFYELIPLFSYIFLRGKCKHCKAKIGFLSFCSELLSGFLLLFAFIYTQTLWEFSFLSLYLLTLLLLSLIDIRLKAVPESLLFLALILAFCFSYNKLFIEELLLFGELKGFLLYTLCFAGGIFLLKSLVSCMRNFKKQNELLESMGEADIIIIASMGGILGFTLGFYMLFLACLLSLPFFAYLHFKHKDKELAFLPFLSLAFVGILLAEYCGGI